MTRRDDAQRERVLQAFISACARPTVDDIVEWVERHPEFADDIRRHAEIALEIAQTSDPKAVPSEELVRRSRAITAKHLSAALAIARAKRRLRPPPGQGMN